MIAQEKQGKVKALPAGKIWMLISVIEGVLAMLKKHRHFFSIIGGLVAILVLVPFLYAQEPAEVQGEQTEVQIESAKLAENLYVFHDSGGMGNTTALIGDDGVLMIDAKVDGTVEKLLVAISDLTDKPIRFLINTHWHYDHVQGNEAVFKTGATIIAHENVRKRMGITHDMKALNTTVPPSPEAARPVVTFTKDMTFHLNGEVVQVFHVEPGHTDGDAVIHFQSANVFHMGDLYFEGLYPYIGIYSGGSINSMIKVIHQILLMMDENTKVVPGHGPVTDKTRLQEYVSMLTDIRNNVNSLMAEGKTMEEVVAAKPTRDFDQQWGGGFLPPDQFAGLVYMDLSPEMP